MYGTPFFTFCARRGIDLLEQANHYGIAIIVAAADRDGGHNTKHDVNDEDNKDQKKANQNKDKQS